MGVDPQALWSHRGWCDLRLGAQIGCVSEDFVAGHARLAINESRELTKKPVALRLLYLYDEAALDADNILKPIQDALIKVLL
jgi:hypothetical protein